MTHPEGTQQTGWPSHRPVWRNGAIVLAVATAIAVFGWQETHEWNYLQQRYFKTYLKSWARGYLMPGRQSEYELFYAIGAHDQVRLATDSEVVQVIEGDGTPAFVPTNQAGRNGVLRVSLLEVRVDNQRLHTILRHWIYSGQTAWNMVSTAVWWGGGCLVLGLFVAIPRDRKRREMLKHGRRLCGPEIVSAIEFNQKMTRRRGLLDYPPDGLAFINKSQSWFERIFRNNASRWIRIPRDSEAMHFMVTGDSGTGKSAIIRQILTQIDERGEAGVVYDSALEFLPEFYRPERGDVILNPLDARCPFWTPSDEVQHPAESLSVAESLFPEQDQLNRFFVDAPKRIFAHLLNFKPSPQELMAWMSNPQEIDRRLKGTELAAMIDSSAGPQRSGVLASLNMVADALKLLPREEDTTLRWSAAEWAKKRKGWIFITSKTTTRARLRPLISLWLDLLVLRTMEDGSEAKRKVWFVLDEIANLQRLPQLTAAITESRKANCPIVLGFQEKSQIDTLYGPIAEAILSQPKTKIFLGISGTKPAEWASDSIGKVQYERYRETRTQGGFPQSHSSETHQCEFPCEPLVMDSVIKGLEPLHGYLKHGNCVVPLHVPYLDLEKRHKKFIERKLDAPIGAVDDETAPTETSATASSRGMELHSPYSGQQHYFE